MIDWLVTFPTINFLLGTNVWKFKKEKKIAIVNPSKNLTTVLAITPK